MKSCIKYIELKTDGLRGIARIARVQVSKTGRTLYYEGRVLASSSGHALKANYIDKETLQEFWISNPRRDGADSLLPTEVSIEEDVREEYWVQIRNEPHNCGQRSYKSPGKSKRERELLEAAVRRRDIDRRFRAPRD